MLSGGVLPTDPKETRAEWWLCYLQIRRRSVLSGGCATYRSEGRPVLRGGCATYRSEGDLC